MADADEWKALAKRIQRIEDIEAIKRVKYTYFRCFDTADIEGIADVFTEDVVITVVGGVYKFELQGRDAYLKLIREGAHSEMVTQHNGHHPEIDIIDDRTATGLWYLNDYVLEFRRKQHIMGTAFYRDTYVKEDDGKWRIQRTEFQRIWEISEVIEKKPNVTYSHLAIHGYQMPPGELLPFKRDDL
jgi:uncharacterized protein (TIGR02246 family)